MAKPSWITFNPASGGEKGVTKSEAVKVIAAANTGRKVRTGSATGTTDGGATANLTLSQKATEFITLSSGETAKSVVAYDANGITTTIQGTSNSANLKLASGDNVISGVKATLKVNGTAVSSWDGIDNTAVTDDATKSDPGADSSYSFVITFSIPENQTLAERTHEFTVTNTDSVSSAKVTITQAAGAYTYSDITVTQLPSYDVIPAAGGTVSPSGLGYSQTYGWNGRTSGVGTVTSGGTVTYSKVSGDGTVASDGKVTADSKGTVVSAVTTAAVVKATITLNKKSVDSSNVTVQQAKNNFKSISATKGTVAVSYAKLTAAAQSAVAPSVSGTPAYTLTYDSGSTVSAAPTGYSFKYSLGSYSVAGSTGATITAASGNLATTTLGSTIQKATTGTVTAKGTVSLVADSNTSSSVVSASSAFTVTSNINREGNFVESISDAGTLSYADIAAGGGTSSPSWSNHTVSYTFTSGTTSTTAPAETYGTLSTSTSYAITTVSGLSINSGTGVVTGANRGVTVGAQRSATVTATCSRTYTRADGYYTGSTADVTASHAPTATVKQAANTVSYGDISVTSSAPANLPANGGTRASFSYTASQVATYTSGAVRATKLVNGTASHYSNAAMTTSIEDSTGCPTLSASFDSVTAASLGREIKGESEVSTLTLSLTGSGDKTASAAQKVKQDANAIVSYSEIYAPDYDDEAEQTISLDSSATSYTFKNAGAYQLRTYTSGTTDSDDLSKGEAITVAGAPSPNNSDTVSSALSAATVVKTASTGFSLNTTTTTVSVTANPGTTQRGTFIVTYTVSGNSSKSFSEDISFNQQGSTSYITIAPDSLEFAAAGETKEVTVTSNDTWTLA